MKLDFNRPKGQIYGHQHAVYEQDGKLFDGAGHLIGGDTVGKKETTKPKEEKPTVLVNKENVKKFIRDALHGAPMSESKLYNAVQETDFTWDLIKDVANEMGTIRKYKQGSATMWKLIED